LLDEAIRAVTVTVNEVTRIAEGKALLARRSDMTLFPQKYRGRCFFATLVTSDVGGQGTGDIQACNGFVTERTRSSQRSPKRRSAAGSSAAGSQGHCGTGRRLGATASAGRQVVRIPELVAEETSRRPAKRNRTLPSGIAAAYSFESNHCSAKARAVPRRA